MAKSLRFNCKGTDPASLRSDSPHKAISFHNKKIEKLGVKAAGLIRGCGKCCGPGPQSDRDRELTADKEGVRKASGSLQKVSYR